jgi:hypothetical protein
LLRTDETDKKKDGRSEGKKMTYMYKKKRMDTRTHKDKTFNLDEKNESKDKQKGTTVQKKRWISRQTKERMFRQKGMEKDSSSGRKKRIDVETSRKKTDVRQAEK